MRTLVILSQIPAVLPFPLGFLNRSGLLGDAWNMCRARMQMLANASLLECAEAYVFGHVDNVHQQKGRAQAALISFAAGFKLTHLGGWPDKRVLEIGCGALNLAKEIIPRMPADSYVCIEPHTWLNVARLVDDPEFLRVVLERRATFLNNQEFDASAALSGNARKFDVVFAHSILSHTPRSLLRKWLERVASVLAPKGVVLASLYHHDFMTGSYDVGDSPHTEWEYPLVTILSRKTVAQEAQRVGFTHHHNPELRRIYGKFGREWHDWAVFRWAEDQKLFASTVTTQ